MRMLIAARLAGLSLVASLSAGAADSAPRSIAQPSTVQAADTRTAAPVPFGVGEVLTYKATFGGISAGSGRMEVARIDTIRGRAAYHVVFSIDGGIPFFRVHDRYESWIDVETLASLKHVQRISEGRYKRETTYEMFPESSQYRRNNEPLEPSVPNPLDDGSFIYAVRVAAVKPGETRRDDRYFRPDRNPVILTGVKYDTIKVAAGTFPAVVVRPTIRTKGIFAEGGDAQVWFSDDPHRIPVQVKTKFAKFSLTLSLTSVVYGKSATH